MPCAPRPATNYSWESHLRVHKAFRRTFPPALDSDDSFRLYSESACTAASLPSHRRTGRRIVILTVRQDTRKGTRQGIRQDRFRALSVGGRRDSHLRFTCNAKEYLQLEEKLAYRSPGYRSLLYIP